MTTAQTHDLARFSLSDMIALGSELRRPDPHARSMEDVAQRVVGTIYERLHAPDGGLGCALVRLYKTIRFSELSPDLQAFARSAFERGVVDEDTPCLTLLGSTGIEDVWRSRTSSQGHRAIPLPSTEIVSRLPMVAQLIKQFGLDLDDVVQLHEELILEPDQSAFNVFFVEEAAGSAHVPAQDDFVVPYGVRSVLGFGGMLPGPDLFAVILFSTVPIDRGRADLFKTIAVSIKLALLPFAAGPILAERSEAGR